MGGRSIGGPRPEHPVNFLIQWRALRLKTQRTAQMCQDYFVVRNGKLVIKVQRV